MRASRLLLVLCLVAVGGVLLAVPVWSSAGKSFTGRMTFTETDNGKTPLSGTGTFSGKLSGKTRTIVRAIATAAGVPYSDVARGGSYAVRWTVDGKGDFHGQFAAKLKSPGAGTLCASYVTKHGKYGGGGFVPTTGSFTATGGTGKLAKVHGSGTFDLTNVSGAQTEVFSAKGAAHASLGKARRPGAACKALLAKAR